MKRLRFTRACFVNGELATVNAVADLDDRAADELIAMRKACEIAAAPEPDESKPSENGAAATVLERKIKKKITRHQTMNF